MIVYRSETVSAPAVPPAATAKPTKLFKCSACRDRGGRYGVHCSKCMGDMPNPSDVDGSVDIYV